MDEETALKISEWAKKYNVSSFISDDPIQFPHRFVKKQDIEISAFLTAWICYGRREIIVKKAEWLHGYTVCWDGDVSERGFSFKNGVAINPEVEKMEDFSETDRARFEKMDNPSRMTEVFKFEHPYPEVKVTPDIRQQGYEAFVTTDDHLMHITGIVKDQNGTKYYLTKNSWGTDRNNFGGYLNMSESFVRAKTIYIMIHKEALSKEMRKKLNIQ